VFGMVLELQHRSRPADAGVLCFPSGRSVNDFRTAPNTMHSAWAYSDKISPLEWRTGSRSLRCRGDMLVEQ
jgi:hypothetical protein